MSSALLKTKLYIPQTRPQLVHRPPLIERLNQSLRCKLTIISAPPGFGKTTLLSEWIYHKNEGGRGEDEPADNPVHPSSFILQPSQTAWVSLDELDNDPARFWSYVLESLETTQPGMATDAISLLNDPQSSIETTLTTLINDVTDMPEQLVLILDDYHVIETEAIHQALSFLIDHLPPQLRLMMTTRTDPPLPLNRLRVRNQLYELRENDLRFTAGEAATFLNQIMGLNLSAEDVTALEVRTEGWIAGLQLAALAMQSPARGHTTPQDFVKAFTGSHRYVIDYLAEEVLAQQPKPVQEFMLKTSIFERLSGSLCDAVVGDLAIGDWRPAAGDQPTTSGQLLNSGHDILTYLDQANLFLIPLDDERRWYRYHHLFADFLREQLHQTFAEAEITALNRRASAWFAQNDLFTEAVNCALAAGDVEQAAALIEQIIIPMLTHGQIVILLGWLNKLPEETVLTRPRLTLGKAWARIIMSRIDDVEALLQAAEKILNTSPDYLEAVDIQGMQGEIAAMRAMRVALDDKGLPEAIRLSQQALDKLSPENYLVHGVINMNMGNIYVRMDKLQQARERFTNAVEISQQQSPNNIITAMISTHGIAVIEEEQGRLRESEQYHRRAIAFATGRDGKLLSLAGLGYIGLAEVMRERNELDTARENLLLGLDLARQTNQHGEIQVGHIILARILQAIGDASGALQAIQVAVSMSGNLKEGTEWVGSSMWAAAIQARLHLMQGHVIQAIQWANDANLPVDNNFNYVLHPGEYSTLVRVYMAQERFEEAANLLRKMLAAAEASERWGRVLEITLLQALNRYAGGAPDKALAPLTRSLSLAEPENYVRTYVDEGLPMAQLLHLARSRGVPQTAYIDKLLAAFPERMKDEGGRMKVLPLKAAPSLPQLLIEPLSERETEVLRLIADGFSNREIAEQLFITVGTAKTHANNIYRKLDVRSRTQAVAKATELGLL